MKFYSWLFYIIMTASVGVKAAVFPASRFPFEGKMDTKDIPQFITITFDDGFTGQKYASTKKYILDIKDSRDCPPRITHFTSFDWTQCEPIRFLYDSGAVEQAHHTGPHAGRPSVEQIKSAMDQLEACGVPRTAITGFRTPYLNYNESTLVNLEQLGVVYDSTIIQNDDADSGYGANNTWPFTLENGFTGSVKCGLTGTCLNASYPNMWEIPMYRWYDVNNSLVYDIMDYSTFATDVHQMFLRRYNGNRAPFGIYLHEPWLNKDGNGEFLKSWIQQIMGNYSDAYFVTNMDLLEWMQNPVPKSQYVPKACKRPAEMFGCLAPAPTYDCGWGRYFDFGTCKCAPDCKEGFCSYGGGPSNGGWCDDCPPASAPVAAPVATPVATPPLSVPVATPIAAPINPVPAAAPAAAPVPTPTLPVPVAAPVPTPPLPKVVFPASRFPFEGKMDTKDIPQFITITFDDGFTGQKYASTKKYILDIKDSRDCPPRITHFTSFDWTQCEPIRFLYDSGAVEQAHHTGPHAGRPSVEQIKSAMDQLEACGVPRTAITGFRTPYLNYNESTLVNLEQLGVVYDSTIIQNDDADSGYGANNTWPFTLENGFTGSVKCGLTGTCLNASYPNMWEIPMYRWYDVNNSLVYDIMDYSTFATDVHQMFLRRYNGNRAPFGIYLHEPWLNKDGNGEFLKSWIQQIMGNYSDAYFVTNMDLLEWMQNPVPKSQYVPKACKRPEEMFGCLAPAPTYDCGWGRYFDFGTCKCAPDCKEGFCSYGGGPSNGGWCDDCPPASAPVAAPVATPVATPPLSVPVATPIAAPINPVPAAAPAAAPVPTPTLPVPAAAPVPTPTLPVPVAAPVPTPTLPVPVAAPVPTPTLPVPAAAPVPTPTLPVPVAAPVPTPTLPVPVAAPVPTPTLPVPAAAPVPTPTLPVPAAAPVPTPTLPVPVAAPVPTPTLSVPVATPIAAPVSAPTISLPVATPVRVPTAPTPVTTPVSLPVSVPVVAPVPVPTPVAAPVAAPTPVIFIWGNAARHLLEHGSVSTATSLTVFGATHLGKRANPVLDPLGTLLIVKTTRLLAEVRLGFPFATSSESFAEPASRVEHLYLCEIIVK